jgi:hypothetical protein
MPKTTQQLIGLSIFLVHRNVKKKKSDSMHSSRKLTHLLIAFVLSLVLVGLPLGYAYATGGIDAIVLASLALLAAPALAYSLFSSIGMLPELRGRERFIASNPALWIFCVIFYTAVIYTILRWRHAKNIKSENK